MYTDSYIHTVTIDKKRLNFKEGVVYESVGWRKDEEKNFVIRMQSLK